MSNYIITNISAASLSDLNILQMHIYAEVRQIGQNILHMFKTQHQREAERGKRMGEEGGRERRRKRGGEREEEEERGKRERRRLEASDDLLYYGRRPVHIQIPKQVTHKFR